METQQFLNYFCLQLLCFFAWMNHILCYELNFFNTFPRSDFILTRREPSLSKQFSKYLWVFPVPTIGTKSNTFRVLMCWKIGGNFRVRLTLVMAFKCMLHMQQRCKSFAQGLIWRTWLQSLACNSASFTDSCSNMIK